MKMYCCIESFKHLGKTRVQNHSKWSRVPFPQTYQPLNEREAENRLGIRVKTYVEL